MNGFFPHPDRRSCSWSAWSWCMLRLDWLLTLVALGGGAARCSRPSRRSAGASPTLATDARVKESASGPWRSGPWCAIRVDPGLHHRAASSIGASSARAARACAANLPPLHVPDRLRRVRQRADRRRDGRGAVDRRPARHGGRSSPSASCSCSSATSPRSTRPINSLTQTCGLIQGARVGAERVFEILETAPDLRDGPRSLSRAEVRGAVTLRGRRTSATSRDARCSAASTSTCAPAIWWRSSAPTGAGKTTLVSLVPRFYDPPGRAASSLDGIDVREFQAVRASRSRSAWCCSRRSSSRPRARQHRLRPPAATRAEIEEAVAPGAARRLPRAACPQGLDTVVGRGGRDALRRRAAAHHDRARHPARRADPDPRRADGGARRDHRGARHARARDADGGPDDLRHRAPAVHRAARRRDPRARRRARIVEQGRVRGAGRPRRSLRAPARDASSARRPPNVASVA